MATVDLTAARLRELFSYDPETGEFRRLVKTANCSKIGEFAGQRSEKRHSQIRIFGRLYMAHRLAWLYIHGQWPQEIIDHINGVKTDNRLSNLREATKRINGENQRRAKSGTVSALLGVSAHGKKWRAQIVVAGKWMGLGSFDTPEDAHAAYITAKRAMHIGNTI